MTVSIVIPTFERPRFLDRLLQSIERQTYRDFEVIIIDDCSVQSKDIQQVAESYSKKFSSLTYLKNSGNFGAPYSRNRGIKCARGKLIALVDDDDEWLPEKLKKQVEKFETGDEKLGLVYTWTKAIDKGVDVLLYQSVYEGNPLRELLQECFIPSPSVMVKRSAIIEAGLFDEQMPSCQDWDMWTRILSLGYSCQVVKSVQALYHKHHENTIGGSPLAHKGYERYYRKHLELYRKYHKSMYIRLRVRYFFGSIKRKIGSSCS